eukprot:236853_1
MSQQQTSPNSKIVTIWKKKSLSFKRYQNVNIDRSDEDMSADERVLEETYDEVLKIPSLIINKELQTTTNIKIPPHQQQTVKQNSFIQRVQESKFFLMRIMIILLTMFMLILSISYTISQILTLQLSDYFCDPTTLEQIKQHSIENNLPHGQADSCWVLKDIPVDDKLLWSTKSYGYKLNVKTRSIIRCFAFGMLSVAFLFSVFYHIIMFSTDIILYKRGTLGRQEARNHVQPNTSDNQKCSKLSNKSKFIRKGVFFIQYYIELTVIDSATWCIKTIILEIIEICVQTSALLTYNGARRNLAYEPKYIELFSTIIFVNCILCGVMWFFYAFKNRSCYGVSFQLVLDSWDSVWDLFYVTFPMIIVWNYDNSSLLTGLASLETGDGIRFLAAFIPTILLLTKCWTMSTRARVAMKRFYGNKFYIQKPSVLKAEMVEFKESNAGGVSTDPSAPGLERMSTLYVSLTNSWIDTESKYISRCAKRFILTIASFCFVIYGTVQLVAVVIHFKTSKTYCSSVIDNLDLYYEQHFYNNSNRSNGFQMQNYTYSILYQSP